VGSWSKLAKALPPAGRNFQEEVASPASGPGAALVKLTTAPTMHLVGSTWPPDACLVQAGGFNQTFNMGELPTAGSSA
jgi:hypothetical protein